MKISVLLIFLLFSDKILGKLKECVIIIKFTENGVYMFTNHELCLY